MSIYVCVCCCVCVDMQALRGVDTRKHGFPNLTLNFEEDCASFQKTNFAFDQYTLNRFNRLSRSLENFKRLLTFFIVLV